MNNEDERAKRDKMMKNNRANRFKSIDEYFLEADGDFDSCDITYDILICCVEPYISTSKKNDDEYYDKFTQYIYDNVNVLAEETEQYNTVCDWEGFVYKHYDTLYKFAEENWKPDVHKMDEDKIVYEWIKEIQGWLTGYTSEPLYKELYQLLEADKDKPDCEKYKDFYEREIKPYYDPDKQIMTYRDFTSDYESADFGAFFGIHPVKIAVNTDEEYLYLTPVEPLDEDFRDAYNEAMKECIKFGKKLCQSNEDFNYWAEKIAYYEDDFHQCLEVGNSDYPFPDDSDEPFDDDDLFLEKEDNRK